MIKSPTVEQIESGLKPVLVDITNVARWVDATWEDGKYLREVAPILIPPFLYMQMIWRNGDYEAVLLHEPDSNQVVCSFSIYQKQVIGYLISLDDGIIESAVNDEFGDYSDIEDLAVEVIFIIGCAISFMHCKNVELRDMPVSRQYRRMMKRKNKPITVYKELDIDLFQRQVRYESQQDKVNEISRALHICRGHFATYTEDAPLFGKLVGTFWKPMHIRGTKAGGEIRKTYKVNAP